MKGFIVVLLLVLAMFVGGCSTWNQLAIDPTGDIKQTTSPASVASMNNEGVQVGSYQGLAPSNLKQDADGNWVTMGGPVGILSYNPKSGQIYMVSPQDAVLTGVEFTPAPAPGKPAFKAASISFNISEPLKQHVTAYASAAAALQGMTKEEALARIEQWKIAGQITAEVAQMLITYIVPLL